MMINAVTATQVVLSNQNRRYLYLENNSAVDFRWGFDSTVTMSGATAGAKLAAGERREYATENFGPITKPIWMIAASGTPDLIVFEASA
jgi:predicted secreted protein